MSKAVKLPSFAKLIKSHNEAIKEYEALDKARFKGSDSYIVKVSDFAIDNDGEYINFSSSNQFVNSMFAETFEKLANALLSDAGIKRKVSTGDGDEGAVYLEECTFIEKNVDIIEEASILLKSGFRGTREEVLQEAKLKAAARNDLPDSDFGLPEDRKYPLNDAAHVKAAIKMFSHCPDAKKDKLAKRITTAMGKFGIDTKFNKDSPMYDYVSAKYRAE